MKKILLCGALFIATYGRSQNVFPTAAGTNVGIGTGATAPSTRLQVTSATAGTSGVRLTNLTSSTTATTGNGKALSVDASGNIILTPTLNTISNVYSSDGVLSANRTMTMNGKNLTVNPSTANSQFFINGTSGKVGIGTITPKAFLDINGLTNGQIFADNVEQINKTIVLNVGSLVTSSDPSSAGNRLLTFFDMPTSNLISSPRTFFNIEDRNDNNRFRHFAITGESSFFQLNDRAQKQVFQVYEDGEFVQLNMPKVDSHIIIGGAEAFPIAHQFWVKSGTSKFEKDVYMDTNLGIGTTSFVDGADVYRLAVKGAIRADRVKVYTTWADFVFEDKYKLPTIQEVEKQIKSKGHLKDIPSAKEVEKSGIELGEMNKLLLQKIEEMTLYIIDLNKRLGIMEKKTKN